MILISNSLYKHLKLAALKLQQHYVCLNCTENLLSLLFLYVSNSEFSKCAITAVSPCYSQMKLQINFVKQLILKFVFRLKDANLLFYFTFVEDDESVFSLLLH